MKQSIFSVFVILIIAACNNPANSGKPALTGQVSFITATLRVGEPVTAAFNGNGTGEQTWRWYRITSIADTELASGSNTYIPVAADIGFPLKATVSFANQSGSISATTVQLVAPAPTYGISFSVTDAWTFPDAVQGYGEQTAFSVSVTNTGNQPTSALSVALTGTNAGNFTLSTTSLNNINPGAVISNAFTVKPNNGLAAGIYTASVSAAGGNNISAQFNVSFTVTAIYGISLSETGRYTFASVAQGYGIQTALSIDVANIGDQATGNLSVELSGPGADSFTLSQTSLDSMTAGGSMANAFTVRPNNDLGANTYIATVTVSGSNDIGAQFDVSFTVNPIGPSAPLNFTATPGNAQVTLFWTAPLDNGGSAITGYQVSGNNGLTWVTASSNTGHTFTGLTNGTSYTFQVRALNAAGNGTAVSVAATPVTTPSAPLNFTATSGNTQVALSWAIPENDGGSPIIRYDVSNNNGASWLVSPNNAGYTFTDLTNGTIYTFKVRAVNAIGNGTDISAVATPRTIPSVPQNFTAVPGNAHVTLSWTAPSSNGGSAITGYQVSSNNGSTWVTASSNTGHTFTSLTNGTSYTFQVRAVNAAGSSTAASIAATPIPTVSSAPVNLTATPGNAQVALSWTAPSDNGGSAITGYQVSSDNGSTWTTITSTSHTFASLTNGTSYTFQVRAVNAVGNSTAVSVSAAPFTIPFAPQSFTATPGNAQVVLSWIEPISNGGSVIIGYQVSSNNGSTWGPASSNTGHTFTGLTNGTSYAFQVRAVNAAGNGTAASVSATPRTTPSAPLNFTATPGNTQAVLSWTAPSDNGGSAITGYQVSSDNGSTWVTASSNTGHTFTSLTSGTSYVFQVRAVNIAGNGTAASVSSTPFTIPSAPQNFTATPGNAQVVLSWTAPSDNGGSAITGYQVSGDNGLSWVTATSNTSHTFSGLTNGTSYTFQVRAVNAAGNSATASVTATPRTIPSAPQNFFTSTPGYAQVMLSWTAPLNDGGSAITGYQVSSDNGSTWVTASNNTGHTFTGLSNGQYTFRVRAVNAAGAGVERTQTATLFTVSFDTRAPAVNNPESITVIRNQPYGALPFLTPPTTISGGAIATFNGWWTAATGGTQVTESNYVTITADQTLYARWYFSSGSYHYNGLGEGTGRIFYRADGQNGRPLGFTVEGYAGGTGSYTSYTAYYLEAAPENSGTAQWGSQGALISDLSTDGNIIGNGRRNTRIIVAHLGTKETSRAAQLCVAAMFGGQNDWFLPSLGELKLLYQERDLQGIGITSGYYWSSSQANNDSAYFRYFGNDFQSTYYKYMELNVRAIRAF